MKMRLLMTVAISGVFGFLLAARAQDDPPPAPMNPGQLRDDSVLKQQILQRQFAEFEQDLPGVWASLGLAPPAIGRADEPRRIRA